MEPSKSQPRFSIVIEEINPEQIEQAVEEFSKVFSLDKVLVKKILQSAPIVFLSELLRAELKLLTPFLTELSKKGIVFKVTAALVDKLPSVSWPVRPSFTEGNITISPARGINWEGSAFICPNCGEAFLFKRVGRVPSLEELRLPPEPLPAEPAMEVAPVETPEEPTKVLESPFEEVAVEKKESLQEIEKPELLEPLHEEAPEFEEAIPFEELPAEGDSTKLREPEMLEEAKLEPVELEDVAPAKTSPKIEAKKREETTRSAKAEKQIILGPAPSGRELYSVFLMKITSKDAREKAVDLIAQVKGVSKEEARELSTRMLIPLLKDVSKKEAEDALARFKKLGISGKITKQK